MIIELNMYDRAQRMQFLNVPYQLSKKYHTWIPGLKVFHKALFNPLKNPFLREVPSHFYICKKNNQIKGRIALFGPGYFSDDMKAASFGFADFINDYDVSMELFQIIEKSGRESGATKIIGPFNPNIHYDLGILTNGFDLPNTAFMNYNPAYYTGHFERSDWEKLHTFNAWQLAKEDFTVSASLLNIEERITKNRNIIFRSVRIDDYKEELKILFDLYCNCFTTHWGFEKPDREEFNFIAADLKRIIQSHMAMIAEYNNKPIGFVLGVPDIYHLLLKDKGGNLFPFNWWRLTFGIRKLTTMRIMIAGILPQYRNTGIYAALFLEYTRNLFQRHGITGGEISWVMDGNASMANILTGFGAKRIKEYILFQKKL